MPRIVVPHEVEDELLDQLLGAEDKAEVKRRDPACVAAGRIWEVIVGLPKPAREATLRLLGGDDRALAAPEIVMSEEWECWSVPIDGVDRDEVVAVIDSVEHRIAGHGGSARGSCHR